MWRLHQDLGTAAPTVECTKDAIRLLPILDDLSHEEAPLSEELLQSFVNEYRVGKILAQKVGKGKNYALSRLDCEMEIHAQESCSRHLGKQHFRVSLKTHPSRHGDKFRSQFKAMQAAYEILESPRRRHEYLEQLLPAINHCAACNCDRIAQAHHAFVQAYREEKHAEDSDDECSCGSYDEDDAQMYMESQIYQQPAYSFSIKGIKGKTIHIVLPPLHPFYAQFLHSVGIFAMADEVEGTDTLLQKLRGPKAKTPVGGRPFDGAIQFSHGWIIKTQLTLPNYDQYQLYWKAKFQFRSDEEPVSSRASAFCEVDLEHPRLIETRAELPNLLQYAKGLVGSLKGESRKLNTAGATADLEKQYWQLHELISKSRTVSNQLWRNLETLGYSYEEALAYQKGVLEELLTWIDTCGREKSQLDDRLQMFQKKASLKSFQHSVATQVEEGKLADWILQVQPAELLNTGSEVNRLYQLLAEGKKANSLCLDGVSLRNAATRSDLFSAKQCQVLETRAAEVEARLLEERQCLLAAREDQEKEEKERLALERQAQLGIPLRSTVILEGLKKRSDLNGSMGIYMGLAPNRRERYIVRVDGIDLAILKANFREFISAAPTPVNAASTVFAAHNKSAGDPVPLAKPNIKSAYVQVPAAKPRVQQQQQAVTTSSTQTFWIPEKEVAFFIGPKGSNIKGIEAESGASVSVEANKDKPGSRAVYIRGNPSCIGNAKACIERFLQERKACGENEQHVASTKRTAALSKKTAGSTKTIWIPEREVAFFIGVKGANIKDIEAESGASILVEAKKTNPGSRAVYVEGTETEIRKAQMAVDHYLQRRKVTVWIPQWDVSAFIGVGGANVRAMHLETGTRIEVDKQNINEHGCCAAYFHGNFRELQNAQMCLERFLDERDQNSDVHLNPSKRQEAYDSAFASLPSMSAQVQPSIDNTTVGSQAPSAVSPSSIPNRKKTSANPALAATNQEPNQAALASIPKETMVAGAPPHPPTLQTTNYAASCQPTRTAPTVVSAHSKTADAPVPAAKPRVQQQQQAVTTSSTQTIWIPEKEVAFFIGPKGSNIKGIEAESGASVSVEANKDKPGSRAVYIRGNPSCIGNAKTCIERFLQERKALGDIEQPLAATKQPAASKTVWIPEKEVAFFIGVKGANIKAIEAECGASILVEVKKTKPGSRAIYLAGTETEIRKAQMAVNQYLQRRKVTVWIPQWDVSAFIGVGGSNVRAMHLETGTRIEVDKHSINEHGCCAAYFHGNSRELQNAQMCLERFLDERDQNSDVHMHPSTRQKAYNSAFASLPSMSPQEQPNKDNLIVSSQAPSAVSPSLSSISNQKKTTENPALIATDQQPTQAALASHPTESMQEQPNEDNVIMGSQAPSSVPDSMLNQQKQAGAPPLPTTLLQTNHAPSHPTNISLENQNNEPVPFSMPDSMWNQPNILQQADIAAFFASLPTASTLEIQNKDIVPSLEPESMWDQKKQAGTPPHLSTTMQQTDRAADFAFHTTTIALKQPKIDTTIVGSGTTTSASPTVPGSISILSRPLTGEEASAVTETVEVEPVSTVPSGMDSLLLFLCQQKSCLKCEPEVFYNFLRGEDIQSLMDLKEAVDDDDFIKEMQSSGLKGFKKVSFKRAVSDASTDADVLNDVPTITNGLSATPVQPAVINQQSQPAVINQQSHVHSELECPICYELMVDDPVLASDGYTYERHAIESWFKRHQQVPGGIRSPMTNLLMADFELLPNKALRAMARDAAARAQG